ncbi:Hypothetical_protein [Hexamita inflata]|uniref:Hypothetical_protein n=1 Tax=Hexamita inflata TaxID=28002 RepID=A0ABP1HN88_9EUKA
MGSNPIPVVFTRARQRRSEPRAFSEHACVAPVSINRNRIWQGTKRGGEIAERKVSGWKRRNSSGDAAAAKQKYSDSGNRTRISWVKTRNANRYTKSDQRLFAAPAVLATAFTTNAATLHRRWALLQRRERVVYREPYM